MGAEVLGRFEHGGDIYAHVGVLDFSANLNPLGMPEEVKQVLRDSVDSFMAYPDPHCRSLTKALACKHHVGEDAVICTSGATDLIERVCSVVKPKAALVTAPCFSGYEEPLDRLGTRIVRHPLYEEDGFAVTPRFLDGIEEGIDLVFLCSPNNPTGVTLQTDLIDRVCRKAQRVGARVVLDECFLDFTDVPSCIDLCQRYEGLLVMRAFTKMYAMAGLRLGYGICFDGDFMRHLRQAGQTWIVSTPAQLAGMAALESVGWIERSREAVRCLRSDLASGLRACGLKVIDGEANYLLIKSEYPLYESLLERGILIRRCENYEGLDGRWFRVAVRTAEENERLLAALQEVCQ